MVIQVSELIGLEATVEILGTVENQQKKTKDIVGEVFHSVQNDYNPEELIRQLEKIGLISYEEKPTKDGKVRLYTTTVKGEQVYSLMNTRNQVNTELNREIIETIKRGDF